MANQTTLTRGVARRLLSLLPPLRQWFAEIDRMASESRQWRRLRTAVLTEEIIAAARHVVASEAHQQAILQLLSHLTPRRAVQFPKIRVGRDRDGGYVLLDDFAGVSAALSFGIAKECSWDTAIAARGIEVYQYDPSVDGPPVANPRFHFFKKEIAATPSDAADSLGSTLARLPPSTGRVILKIDIEGAEWDVFDAATPEELARFSQIVGEFHHFSEATDQAWRDRAERVLAKLRSVFDVVHIHGNNCGPFNVVANVAIPSSLEVTFANRAIYDCSETDEIFPTPLDRPNWECRPDIFLGSMRFR